MRRFACMPGALAVIALTSLLAACGSSSTKVVSYPVPANVVLAPATSASMDVGTTLNFTAQPQDYKRAALTEPVSFFSSNPAVVTIAANGIACAGTWDSISNPQICTPGPVGVAQITASAQGVISPPTTLYVHQHVDRISVSPLPTQSNPAVPCVTKGQTFQYVATAFSKGTDITSTVGQFSWQTVNTDVVTLTSLINGTTSLNEIEATAALPGVSSTFAGVGGVNSVPFDFVTCPVQSIQLSVNGSSSDFLSLTQATTQTVTATVTDSLGNAITGVPLTWSSSNPSSVTVAGITASNVAPVTATISAATPGGASVIASCTPPICNVGFQPSLPIYPQASIGIAVTPASGTTTPATGTLYVSSEDCQTNLGCITTIVPVTLPANTLGSAIDLPSTPNSAIFSRDGNTLYLGTDLGDLGTRGIMRVVSSAVTQNTSVVGKVVAVSPDGSKVIVADLVDPNSAPQVFIYDTGSGAAITIPTPGATSVAADFSPDSLKAFIVANSGSAGTLFIYSKLDALQTIPLAVPGTDVAFLPSGNFGYITDAPSSLLSIVPTCDNPPPGTAPAVLTTAATAPPELIRPIIDGRMLALEPPGIEIITPTVSGNGCAFPRPYPGSATLIPGTLTVSNTSAFFNLGEGTFSPTQLIISPDGSSAFILGTDTNHNPLSVVIVFSIINHTASAISLANNATPLQIALSVDGTVLYVGASDGTVHVISTVSGGDFQQISFPSGLCRNAAGATYGGTCNPDLLAIMP